MADFVSVGCPYCGETVELMVDSSAGSAAYVEDCPVCCRPMQVTVAVDGEAVSVRVRTGDE
ncbi:MAG TPA: CPXCG motif-containing cysteine-rich protein [Rhodanobacteraceae bacterium]|nr:CPXCG motif-containing cysteine-rich protein [Rhodanobacteraceae bacterium]